MQETKTDQNSSDSYKELLNKNILIIGGAGLIGSGLCNALAKKAFVTSLDNYSSGSILNHVPDVRYIEGDAKNVNDIFTNKVFDYVFHFGEYSRVENSLEFPSETLNNNLGSIGNVLEYCRINNCKLIYSGSSTKFTNDTDGKFLSPYTFTKAQNSELVVAYSKWYNIKHCIVYFYNVYGPNEVSEGQFSTVIAKFIKLKKEGYTKLPVTRPGTQTRNFTHIDDIVSGLLIAGAKGSGDLYGIGSDESYSILDVCELFGCQPEFNEPNIANRMGAKLATSKMKSLGWNTRYNLKDYILENLAV